MDEINEQLTSYLETHICDNIVQVLVIMLKNNLATITLDSTSKYYKYLKELLGEK